ncbi:protein kinase domain-containing protein [Candidatus Uabimicrobium amorphum]|uniref:non-specific serine/threonine protein kinase n=1 Tax=Uabimicrobium amorphum TaxID=2596890 RepID=A0A5S9F6H4_UABAM|nr:SUMF1/EgtB/PvdO family nonheme iron enzyme [Candidatus Uabimicrobium amorphum]BBM87391.1 protein kinase [Candidatus Uabimicrobium amorphum]
MGNAIKIGQEIGGCKLVRVLGQGGMGTVFEAVKLSLNKKVAMKILHRDLCNQKNLIQRFFQEAKAAAVLNHPNIVSISNVGEQDGHHYMEMEYIHGQTLKQRIQKDKFISVPKALFILKQVAFGLQFAHDANILHRDIKPANIMLTNHGEVKITDFGLAKFMDQDFNLSKTGEFLGTPYYIAPEIVTGEETIDTRADIYSLGISFYEMLSGKIPFRGKTPMQIAYKHVTEPLPPLQDAAQHVPEIVENLIKDLSEKDPRKRIANMDALIARIEEIENVIDDNTFPMKRSSQWLVPRRTKRLSPIILLFALGIVVWGVVHFLPQSSKNSKNNIQQTKNNPSTNNVVAKQDKSKALWEQSNTLVQQQKYDLAHQKLQELIENYPDSPYQQQACEKNEVVLEIIARRKKEEQQKRKIAQIWDKANELYKNNNYKDAQRLFLEITTKYPTSSYNQEAQRFYKSISATLSRREWAKDLWARASKAFNQREYQQAQKFLKKLIEEYPDPLYLEKAQKKQRVIREYILDNESAKNIWARAQREMSNKNYKDALQQLQKLISRYPQTTIAATARKAKKQLERQLQQQKNIQNQLQNGIAVTKKLLAQKKYSQAITSFGKLRSQFPSAKLNSLYEELYSKILPTKKKIAIGNNIIEFVFVPSGSFVMGTAKESPHFRQEETPHKVVIHHAFYIGKYEVTTAQYNVYKKHTADKQHPVTNVSWDDAHDYCTWLSKQLKMTMRLPSEAEWEYACKAGQNTTYSWGENAAKNLANYTWEQDWVSNWRDHGTVAVGSYPPNSWGIHDMHGNVWEWTASMYSFVYNGTETKRQKGKYMAIRGGGWNYHQGGMRSSYRSKSLYHKKNPWTGFRLVMELAPHSLQLLSYKKK